MAGRVARWVAQIEEGSTQVLSGGAGAGLEVNSALWRPRGELTVGGGEERPQSGRRRQLGWPRGAVTRAEAWLCATHSHPSSASLAPQSPAKTHMHSR